MITITLTDDDALNYITSCKTKPAVDKPINAGKAWTDGDVSKLQDFASEGKSPSEIAKLLCRTPYAITTKAETYGVTYENSAWVEDED